MVEQAGRKRPRLESAGGRTARQQLQPRPQEPTRQDGLRALAAGATRRRSSEEGTANRRDHYRNQERSGTEAMSTKWPRTRLREILTERRETPDAEKLALGEIRIISKIGFNGGKIEFRSEAGTKTGMILVRPGDLVVSGINAAKGAIAIYGEENDAPVAATIRYGAYEVHKDRADVTYLWWYLRSGAFREVLLEAVPGGIKTELKSSRLLPIEIPLPPLAEQ